MVSLNYRFLSCLACEQALIFVVIKDVVRAAKPRVKVPDLSPARCARRLVTRDFAARATSFITDNENESLLAGYIVSK